MQIKKNGLYIMNILIYTYGNHKMGMGHIYRMSYLSEILEKNGHIVLFLVLDWKEGLKKLKEKKRKIIKIPFRDFEQNQAYQKILKGHDFDCIIVDALKVSKRIMKLFREKTKVLLSLDNVGQGRFFSDILINILYKDKPKLKKPKIEINDFNYLILNKNFQQFNLKKKIINKKVRKILITQGGSDTYGIVPKIINELSELPRRSECYVLIGSAFKHHRELILSIKNNDLKVKILKDIKEPWKLFYEMDMAISGGGMTMFELLCVGVPCITLTQEYKEMETINYLKDSNLVESIGLYEKIKKNELLNKTKELINNYGRRIKMSRNGKKAIDAKGCERIVDIIENYFNKLNKK